MKNSIILATGGALFAALCLSGAAQAQSFSGLKDRLKKEAAEEVVEAVGARETDASMTAEPTTATAGAESVTSATLGKPDASLVAMTKCADIKPTNIVIGNVGDYTFQNGFSQEERSGLINRKSATLSDGCILPSLQSRQVAYMEVDTDAYKAMGGSNDWEMQCVKSANPGAGAVGQTEGKAEYPYTVNFLAGKAMMLHCGNSEGIEECAEGSNSSRSGAWDKQLKARGMTMLSVHGNTSTLAPAGGEKLYCQYYNSKTRTSLFAFEYMRTRN